MEELNLGHRLREDQIHKESHLKMKKNSYENLNKKNKLLFLAGLFDGEGSFGVWGKGNGRRTFQCSVEMCDQDSVQKFANFFGGNVIKLNQRRAHWSKTYKWKLTGTRAYECIDKMIQYMCQRRQEKYENVVSSN